MNGTPNPPASAVAPEIFRNPLLVTSIFSSFFFSFQREQNTSFGFGLFHLLSLGCYSQDLLPRPRKTCPFQRIEKWFSPSVPSKWVTSLIPSSKRTERRGFSVSASDRFTRTHTSPSGSDFDPLKGLFSRSQPSESMKPTAYFLQVFRRKHKGLITDLFSPETFPTVFH